MLIRQLFIFVSDQSLAEYFKKYRAVHGFLLPKGDSKSTITTTGHTRFDVKSKLTHQFVHYEESTVKVGPASLKFQRTLRVPDNAKNYLLPPVRASFSDFVMGRLLSLHQGLGTFPLQPAAKFSRNLPDSIKRREGFLMVH